MIHTPPDARKNRGSLPAAIHTQGPRTVGVVVLALLAALTPTGLASVADQRDAGQFRVAATEDRVWLAEIDVDKSRIHTRDHNSAFAPASRPLNGRVVALTAADDELFAFFDDKTWYSLRAGDDTARPERTLPDRSLPVSFHAWDGGVYALVTAAAAAAMQPADATRDANAPSPSPTKINVDDPHLWLAAYDRSQWLPILRTPVTHDAKLTGRLRPRLVTLSGGLWLFWTGVDATGVRSAEIDPTAGQLRHERELTQKPVLAFWPLTVNRVPALVTLGPDYGEGPRLQVLQAAGQGGLRDGEWKPATLTFSKEDAPIDCAAAFAFNQHLGLLLDTQSGQAQLRFARFGSQPVEPDALVAEALGGAKKEQPYAVPLQAVSLAVLLAAIAVVFIFRRRALVATAALPEGMATAFLMQRASALVIDFVPFTLVAAVLLQVHWQDSLMEVVGWAVGSDLSAEGVPGIKVILWWAYSAVCYSAYSLIMELLTRRTVGKVLARIEVASETGERARPGQIVLRNVLRLAELLPPVWALVFLVFLTPRRQRVGDAIAQTMVIRHVTPSVDETVADSEDEKSDTPSDDGPSDSDKEE